MSDEGYWIMMNPETDRLERFPSEVVALKLAARHGLPGAAERLRLVRFENAVMVLCAAVMVCCVLGAVSLAVWVAVSV